MTGQVGKFNVEGAMALTLIHGQRRYIDAVARAANRTVPARRTRRIRKAYARKNRTARGAVRFEYLPTRDCRQSPSRGESLSAAAAIWEDSKTARIQHV
jgi:hypothetical protein